MTPSAEPVDNYRWAPSAGMVVIGWLAALAALAWCVLGGASTGSGAGSDAAGRLLFGAAAVVLGVAALYGSRARPRLAADGSGLLVRGLISSARFEWARVSSVRLVHTRRFGRDVPTLEIEVRADSAAPDGERLLVFGRLDLGTDPRDVADTLHTLRR